ncbi:PPOX class F420-dependent oxidoreductase [Jiangella gansuensis]|uniref:PPOX class F420-dependent oxidoreductase n=1 Tax=Jiangella gansuensis TaxID=281473 RepID=UPI0004787C5C|nr:PPOX class F420-dependent oxidoreductase [Jiangella gansuensis]
MSAFSEAELAYFASGPGLGRLATVDAAGRPRIVPLGWRYNPDEDALDLGGHDVAATRRFRDVQLNADVAFVVDDVLPPWQPRAVIVHGRAEAIREPEALIRIRPDRVISWGLDG